MSHSLAQFDAVSSAWLGGLAAVAWQWSVLVLLMSVVSWLLKRSSPSLRFWLWQLVAFKLLVMPFWSWAVPWPSSASPSHQPVRESTAIAIRVSETAATTSLAPHEAPHGNAETALAAPRRQVPEPEPAVDVGPSVTWQTWLLLAWLAGVSLQIGLIARQAFRLAAILRCATPAGDELASRVKRLTALIGLRTIPRVALIELDCSPFVCGTFRPILVVPRRFLQTLESSRLDQVILHELAHVRRRDLLWGWIPELARMAYFFHPLIYWVCNRVRLERELACDQSAMLYSGGSAAAYAETLLKVVSQTSEPVAMTAAPGLIGHSCPHLTSGEMR